MKTFKDYAYDSECKRLENSDIIDNIYKDTVPVFNTADTEVGEIVRAVSKIVYRYYNDGDQAFLNYGIETVDSPLAYLLDHLMYIDDLKKDLKKYYEHGYTKDLYEDVLNELMSCVVATLEYTFEHNEENTKNTEDSITYDTEVMYKKLNVEPYDEYALDDEDEED